MGRRLDVSTDGVAGFRGSHQKWANISQFIDLDSVYTILSHVYIYICIYIYIHIVYIHTYCIYTYYMYIRIHNIYIYVYIYIFMQCYSNEAKITPFLHTAVLKLNHQSASDSTSSRRFRPAGPSPTRGFCS